MTDPIEVPLGRGPYVALVDAADLPLIERYRWFRHSNGHGGIYVRGYLRGVTPRNWVYLHQVITGLRGADHVNGDGLNCQRVNLRARAYDQAARAAFGKFARVNFPGVG